MKYRLEHFKFPLVGALLGLAGCKTIATAAVVSVAVVVGAAGYVGYGAYKAGKVVVTKIGDVGSSAKDAVQKGHKSVVMSRGTLKSEADYSVGELYAAARTVMHDASFFAIEGSSDALTGSVSATTTSNEKVLVTFALIKKDLTSIEIRIGNGNLKQSEYIYDQILAMAKANRAAANTGGDES